MGPCRHPLNEHRRVPSIYDLKPRFQALLGEDWRDGASEFGKFVIGKFAFILRLRCMLQSPRKLITASAKQSKNIVKGTDHG